MYAIIWQIFDHTGWHFDALDIQLPMALLQQNAFEQARAAADLPMISTWSYQISLVKSKEGSGCGTRPRLARAEV